MRKGMYLLYLMAILLLLAACNADRPAELSLQEKQGIAEDALSDPQETSSEGLAAGVAVHDPSIVKSEDGLYYIFGSHMAVAATSDLRKFTMLADGVSPKNKLFDGLFDESGAFAYVGKNDENGYSVWAPDVIYNESMGKYVMYFSTTSSYIKSSLCMAVSDDIRGPYTFEQVILSSGFTPDTVIETDVSAYVPDEEMTRYYNKNAYNNRLWPNAIDPNVFYDADERMWLTYGSWSGGIFILELNPDTGLPIHPADGENVDAYFGKRLIGGSHKSIEAPYVLYDAQSAYYYLFVSYGSLVREGGYQMRLFRSKNPDGPYLDANGTSLIGPGKHSAYGIKLMGNYRLPSLPIAYMSPGHNSAMTDEDGKLLLVYHTRFEGFTEVHQPRVHQMFRNEEDWLVVAPYAYAGEILDMEGYAKASVEGVYAVVDHSDDISKRIHEAIDVILSKDGRIINVSKNGSEEQMGTWALKDNTPYIDIAFMEGSFKGVTLQMDDEEGKSVMSFTTVSNDNRSLWGVKVSELE